MTPKREKAEELVYKYMDAVDRTGSNTTYYKRLFSTMDDKEFEKFCKKDLPFRFQTKAFDINPTMSDIKKGLSVSLTGVSIQESTAAIKSLID